MSNTYYERANLQWQRNTIEGAVQFFREREMNPLRVGNTCPHCHKGQLMINPVDVDERIKLQIGAYRIAMCDGCLAYCVVYPLRKPKPEAVTVESKTSWAEYNAVMGKWQEANKDPDAQMVALRAKWVAEDASETKTSESAA